MGKFIRKSNGTIQLGGTAAELWNMANKAEEEEKSIHSTGLSRDKHKQNHRMEADRREGAADKISNMAVYAMINGQNDHAKTLMTRASEMRKLANFHRRMSDLL